MQKGPPAKRASGAGVKGGSKKGDAKGAGAVFRGPFAFAAPPAKAEEAVACPVCDRDLGAMGAAERNLHVERCIGSQSS